LRYGFEKLLNLTTSASNLTFLNKSKSLRCRLLAKIIKRAACKIRQISAVYSGGFGQIYRPLHALDKFDATGAAG